MLKQSILGIIILSTGCSIQLKQQDPIKIDVDVTHSFDLADINGYFREQCKVLYKTEPEITECTTGYVSNFLSIIELLRTEGSVNGQ